MLTPILPETDNIVCAECGRIATDMTPEGPRGTLLCICRPCENRWRAENVAFTCDYIEDFCPVCESCEVSLYGQNLDQGVTSFFSCHRCEHDWTVVA